MFRQVANVNALTQKSRTVCLLVQAFGFLGSCHASRRRHWNLFRLCLLGTGALSHHSLSAQWSFHQWQYAEGSINVRTTACNIHPTADICLFPALGFKSICASGKTWTKTSKQLRHSSKQHREGNRGHVSMTLICTTVKALHLHRCVQIYRGLCICHNVHVQSARNVQYCKPTITPEIE